MSWVQRLARADIVALAPYAATRGDPGIERLNANELPWRCPADASVAGLNRYPESQPRELVAALAELYGIGTASVLVTRGSDEAIDLLTRAFCRAGEDSILITPPTFGVYALAARIQGAGIVSVPLDARAGFRLEPRGLLERCTPQVKLVFLCSPNNPTGNLIDEPSVLTIVQALAGRAVVVLDEAYVEFSGGDSLARLISHAPHLVILRTLSKAFGLAGARCGALLGDPEVVGLLQKVIAPFAIPQPTIEAVMTNLDPAARAVASVHRARIVAERARLYAGLKRSAAVDAVWPSEANFVLARFTDAASALDRTRAAGLLIRDVSASPGLEGCLRITVGSPEQNDRLLKALE